MRMDIETFELIERYLNNQLSGKALEDFEERLKEVDFSREVAKHRFVHELVVDKALIDLKTKIKDFDRETSGGGKTKWIVSLTIISFTGILFFFLNRDPIEQRETVKVNRPVPRSSEFGQNQPIKSKKTLRTQSFPVTPKSDSIRPKDSVVTIGVDSIATIVSNQPAQQRQETKKEAETDIQPEKRVLVDPCSSFKATLTVKTEPSCENRGDGRIIIDHGAVIEGAPPFSFSIDNKTFKSAYSFNNLFPGDYSLYIRDDNGCVIKYQHLLIVEEKECSDAEGLEASFSPAKGEEWSLPVNSDSNGDIKIFSKNGSLVYRSAIVNGYPNNWNGRTTYGHDLPMGSYNVILNLDGTVIKGYVTILR